ncbi:DUF6538 domain-containing protein [Ruegeria conchae]|uniref:DUF6538 domain-containing protein n=1 Tax=Ruegeria conchae TaxID=981384 RepID=UPI0039840936
MPSPIKDKNSGIFYLRVRVPADLTRLTGKAEVSKSLRTREPAEAKERFAAEGASKGLYGGGLCTVPDAE